MNRQPGQILYHGLHTMKIPVSKACLKLQPLLHQRLPFKLIQTDTAGDLHKRIKKITGEIKERDHLYLKRTTADTKLFKEAFTEKNRIEKYSKRHKKRPDGYKFFVCKQTFSTGVNRLR
ncbi:MAG: hypothetical protein LC128_03220 [Chitinophagales bacterium]|nr:hypothetical protein [Chitinophagales bacterium]